MPSPRARATRRGPARLALTLATISTLLLATGNTAFAVDKFMVQKTADNPSIIAGDTATFTIVATAITTGTGNIVENFTLTDTLPAGSWSVGGADAASCVLAANVLTCSFGNVLEGATRTVQVSRLTAVTECDTTITNTATVTSDDIIFESGADLLDNTSTASIAVTCAPPPPPSAKITPTGTTCEQFRDGTAGDLTDILYGVRANGHIGNVAPGIGFYFVAWNGGTIHVVQSDSGSTPAFGVQSVQVYTASDCNRIRSVTIGTVGTATTIAGATPGTAYIARLAFDPNTVVGAVAPSPATVVYTYTTIEAAGSTDSVNLAPKP